MGFNKVYCLLLEIFPQIDARALRPVALEHNKDADAAVEAVLVEFIPFFTEKSRPNSPSVKSDSGILSSSSTSAAAARNLDPSKKLLSHSEVENVYQNGGSHLSGHDAGEGPSEPSCDAHYEGESITAGLIQPINIHENNLKMSADVPTHLEPVVLIKKNDAHALQLGTSGVPETVENSTDKQHENLNLNIQTLKVHSDENKQMNIIPENEGDSNHVETDFDADNHQENDQEDSCPDWKSPAFGLTSYSIDVQEHSASESFWQSVVLKPLEESPTDTASMMKNSNDIVVTDDDSSLKPEQSQSNQIRMIDVLHEVIEEARNHKKTLSVAKESVISLMKEVELKEIAAKEAEEEAAREDADIWVKVEELKQMLRHANEANDMCSGEVYGEKAILGTELRELQARLLAMSDERDKYLEVLDKMRETWEERLTAPQNKTTSAEYEKQKMVEAAEEALAEQKMIMENVVKESKILEQHAEENGKLREFLVDSGRAVDTLQGEVAVIYQDIMVLKKKYDENVPFSNLLLSSNSSRSSLKSMSQDPENLSPSGTSGRSMIEDQVELALNEADTRMKETGDDRKVLVEDGWDFFDN